MREARRRAFRDGGTASRRTRPAVLRAGAAPAASPSGPLRASTRARLRRTMRAPSARRPAFRAARRGSAGSTPRARARDSLRSPRPARSSRHRRPRPRAGSARPDPPSHATASFSRSRRAGPAPARRACGRAGRSRPVALRRDRRSPKAIADRPRRVRPAPRDSATTATAAALRLHPGSRAGRRRRRGSPRTRASTYATTVLLVPRSMPTV